MSTWQIGNEETNVSMKMSRLLVISPELNNIPAIFQSPTLGSISTLKSCRTINIASQLQEHPLFIVHLQSIDIDTLLALLIDPSTIRSNTDLDDNHVVIGNYHR